MSDLNGRMREEKGGITLLGSALSVCFAPA